jgi:large subunit ribosomal protein L13
MESWNMKTYIPKKNDIERTWSLIDADGKVLGRLASEVAQRLRGKKTPQFVPYADTGEFVVIVNAEKIRLTGRKWDQKVYYRHTGYIGGIKSITAKKLREKRPEDLIRFAVKGMLPKNSLGRKLNSKLKVYVGPDHPHQAQKPVSVS